jgi:hypothetical protein
VTSAFGGQRFRFLSVSHDCWTFLNPCNTMIIAISFSRRYLKFPNYVLPPCYPRLRVIETGDKDGIGSDYQAHIRCLANHWQGICSLGWRADRASAFACEPVVRNRLSRFIGPEAGIPLSDASLLARLARSKPRSCPRASALDHPEAELGIDYAAEKTKARAELTFDKVCDLYLAEGCDTKKASTSRQTRGRIERHIKPLAGQKAHWRNNAIRCREVHARRRRGKTAADEKTKLRGRAIVEGGRGTATRTVGLLGGIMSFRSFASAEA